MRFLKTTTVIPTEKLKVSLRLTVLLPVLFLLLLSAGAQTERPWVRFFQEVAACEDDDTGLDDETYETLCSLETNPLNINSATPDDLSRLPFLTERQIDDIWASFRPLPRSTKPECSCCRALLWPARRHPSECR